MFRLETKNICNVIGIYWFESNRSIIYSTKRFGYCTTTNNNNPAKLIIRGEYTKTKVDRFVFLTREIIESNKNMVRLSNIEIEEFAI